MLDDLVQVARANNVKMIITSASGGAESLNAKSNNGARLPAIFISTNSGSGGMIKEQSFDLIEMLKPKHSILDIAPTVLDLLGLEKTHEMTGNSLAYKFEEQYET